MEKKMVRLGLFVIVVGLCSSIAIATTIGPPVAGLDAGQFSIGLDYSTSDTTIELDGKDEGYVEGVVNGVVINSTELEDVYTDDVDFDSDMIFANLGYGVSDKLEIFARLGMADLSAEGFNGSDEFAYGLGAKATFYEEAELKLGVLLQITWATSDGEITEDIEGIDEEIKLPLEADWYEIKLAVGPSYQIMESVSVYGGPFYHFIDGEVEGDADGQIQVAPGAVVNWEVSSSADMEAASSFGGYIGAQVDIAENLPIAVEYQFTGDADIFGASLVYRF